MKRYIFTSNIIFSILCGLLIFAQPVAALPFRSELNRGNDHYKKENYPQAQTVYSSILEKNKGNLKARFNLGDSLYKEGRFQESAEVFKSLTDKSVDKDLREKSFYNLGNSFFRQEDYKSAIGAYEEALKIDPKDKDAQFNLELAKKMLNMPKQKKDDKKDNKKDQQKKDNEKNKNNQNQKDDKNKNKNNDKDKNNDPQQQPKPGQMSKEDALRILNALEDKEKHKDRKLKAGRGITNVKDW